MKNVDKSISFLKFDLLKNYKLFKLFLKRKIFPLHFENDYLYLQ